MRAVSRGGNAAFRGGTQSFVRRPKTGVLRRSQTLLGLLIAFPQVTIDKIEDLSELDFGNIDCEKMKNHLFDILIRDPDLDEDGVRYHLLELGYENLLIQTDETIAKLWSSQLKSNVDMDEARRKIDEIIALSLSPRRR